MCIRFCSFMVPPFLPAVLVRSIFNDVSPKIIIYVNSTVNRLLLIQSAYYDEED